MGGSQNSEGKWGDLLNRHGVEPLRDGGGGGGGGFPKSAGGYKYKVTVSFSSVTN